MAKAKTGVTTSVARSKKPRKKTLRVADVKEALAQAAAAVAAAQKMTASTKTPASSNKTFMSKKVAATVSDARTTRTEIEAVLLRLIGKFFRSPVPLDRKAFVRQALKISDAKWIEFGAAINQDAAIVSKGMAITRGQMAGAQSIADIAAHLVASGGKKSPFGVARHKPMLGPVFDAARPASGKSEKTGEAGRADRTSRAGKAFRAPKVATSGGLPSERMPKKASADLPKRDPATFRSRKSPSPVREINKAALDLGVSRFALERLNPSDGPAFDMTALESAVEVRETTLGGNVAAATLNADPPLQPPSFFFELEGKGARGDQALWGHEFDLVFGYGILSGPGLAIVKGKQLTKLVKDDTHATLGIDIVPVGLSLVSGGAGSIVKFKNGTMISKPPRFRLRAPAKDDAGEAPFGIQFIFTVDGALIYTSFLPITLVDTLTGETTATPVIDLDLAEAASFKVDRPFVATLYVITKGGYWQVYGNIDGVILPPRDTTFVSLASLNEAYRSVTLAEFTRIAGNAIWGNLDENLEIKAEDSDAAVATMTASMKATMTAGSRLYKFFSEDPVFKDILEAIEKLPDGARISIASDGTAFPWELLYPLRYAGNQPAENYQPDRFWGRRFIIESVLIPLTEKEKLPIRRRQPGPLRISMGYNSGIDNEAPWNHEKRLLKPVRLQTEYFDTALKTSGKYFDQYDAILETLGTAYVSSLIYYFCHGSANQLKFDGVGATFDPLYIAGDRYPGWPLIFLNACDAADISPLSFFSFRKEFRRKEAAGLIAPSFPVPTLFAAVFAKTFLSAYAAGKDGVGDILFRLRRELLEKNNPLGLWYSLQCPLDLKAPLQPKAPGA